MWDMAEITLIVLLVNEQYYLTERRGCSELTRRQTRQELMESTLSGQRKPSSEDDLISECSTALGE